MRLWRIESSSDFHVFFPPYSVVGIERTIVATSNARETKNVTGVKHFFDCAYTPVINNKARNLHIEQNVFLGFVNFSITDMYNTLLKSKL